MHPFEVLAHPIRRRLVMVLASGEHTSGNLVDVISHEFGVTKAAVSWHLAVLRDNDCVILRQEYTERWYRLDEHFVQGLRTDLNEIRWLWKRRIGTVGGTDRMTRPPRGIQKAGK